MKEVLNEILSEVKESKILNKNLENNIKTIFENFEKELEENKGDVEKINIELSKFKEKMFEELKKQDEKANTLEKKIIGIEKDTETNTTKHKNSNDMFNKMVMLIVGGFVGAVFFLLRSNGAG